MHALQHVLDMFVQIFTSGIAVSRSEVHMILGYKLNILWLPTVLRKMQFAVSMQL